MEIVRKTPREITPAIRPEVNVPAAPVLTPETAPATFQRPRLKEKPRNDLPRQTYYVTTHQTRYLAYWAAVDARGVSEIVREALDLWFARREEQER